MKAASSGFGRFATPALTRFECTAGLRIILGPLKEQLFAHFRNIERITAQLAALLALLRDHPIQSSGYAAGNLLSLLCHLEANITGYNFSGLAVWQAYLQGVNLHEVNFKNADLTTSVFSEPLGPISAVEFSPNGQLFAMGDASGEIRLWQVQDGKQCLICSGHEDWVRSIAFDPTGQLLVSGSGDYTLMLWDTRTGQCLRIFRGHSDRVRAVRFHPAGHLIASASADQTIKLWSVGTGECVRTLEGHSGRVRAIVFSPTTPLLASASEDQTIKLWNLETGQCLKTLSGHTDWVRSASATFKLQPPCLKRAD